MNIKIEFAFKIRVWIDAVGGWIKRLKNSSSI